MVRLLNMDEAQGELKPIPPMKLILKTQNSVLEGTGLQTHQNLVEFC